MEQENEVYEIRALVKGCARCGCDHEMNFREFRDNGISVDGVLHKWWGMCPELGEPVVMAVTIKPSEE